MKKILSLLLVLMLSFILTGCNSRSNENEKGIDLSKYKSDRLEEIFKEEGITYDLGDYKETDDQAIIYLFHGKGCEHCINFLNYVNNTLLEKYGDMFKLVSFEVFNDSKNGELMKKVGNFMGDDVTGVPYIIIGDKTFLGYSESFNNEIESAVTNLYNSTDKYDVFKEIPKNSNGTSPSNKNTDKNNSSNGNNNASSGTNNTNCGEELVGYVRNCAQGEVCDSTKKQVKIYQNTCDNWVRKYYYDKNGNKQYIANEREINWSLVK